MEVLDRRLGFFLTIQGIGNRSYKYQKHIFSRVHSVRTILIDYVWLIRMSELSGFVYIVSHVTLHVKSNAEKVNYHAQQLKCIGDINFTVVNY